MTNLQNNRLFTSASRHSLPSCHTPCYTLTASTEHNRQQHLSTTLHATFSQPAKSGTQHRTQQQTATLVDNTPCYILTASKVWHSAQNTTTDSNTCRQHSMLHSHSQQSLALSTEHNNRQQHLSTTLHATFSQPAKSGTQH